MAQQNSTYNSEALELLVLTCAVIGLTVNFFSILYKIARELSIPKLWKYSLLTNDFAHVFLGIGLILFYVYYETELDAYCDATGFFAQFGIFDCICGFLTAGIILLGIYNPGKSSQISSFHRNVFLVIVIPQKIVSIILSVLPAIPIEYFTTQTNFSVDCFKISQPGDSADKFGVLIIFIAWITILIATTTFIIGSLKLWKGFNNRIHTVSPNVWQAQLVSQGKSLQKFLLIEDAVWIVQLFIVTAVVYTNTKNEGGATWIVYISLAVTAVIHSILSVIQDIMWTSCCCRSSTAVEEPHRKLKRLELIKIEAPGKLRLRVWWNLGKSRALRRGLMKVYEKQHLKAWAQEIVVLGMLRKAQHPSLLQCLWTSSSNPYYDTMTLITGEVINSDSRIICLELTNNGNLQDFLHHLDAPLPESCQRMIVHDIAEGLSHLHDQNILHSNLTPTSVYLKGSLNSMVMRAAIGDFEDSQIYGTLQQNSGDAEMHIDKTHFFLPDIRSFALVALEIVSKMCEKRFLNAQYEWELDQAIAEKYPNRKIPYIEDDMINHYDSETDTDMEAENAFYNGRVRRLPKGVRSPAEVIEEVRNRSRSLSPGSRPMSAQSNKSRSRTLSPDSSRYHHLPQTQKLCPSSYTTQDPDVISPDDEYPSSRIVLPEHSKETQSKNMSSEGDRHKRNRSMSPEIAKHNRSRPMSPESSKLNRSRTLSPESSERPFSPHGKSSGRPDSAKGKQPRAASKKNQKENEKDQQVFEAFAPNAKSKYKSVKKMDSKKWLQKPTSFIKSLTGAETSVSVFKSKGDSKTDSAEEISDEEIECRTDSMMSSMHTSRKDSMKAGHTETERSVHRTSSKQSDQWSILSDMEYRPHGLRNTVSADSKSSMWSNLPVPVEMIDIEGGGEMDDFSAMVGSLPGMTDPLDYSKNVPSVNELLQAKINGEKLQGYWRYDGPGPSHFELIDYYDELKGKYVKKLAPKGFLHRTASGTQILKSPVHRTFSGTQVLHRTSSGLQEIMEQTESADDDELDRCSPTQAEIDESKKILRKAESMKCERTKPVKKIKAKLLKEQKNYERSRSRSRDRSDSKEKRPDTPKMKERKERSIERKSRSSEKKGRENLAMDHSPAQPIEVTKPILKETKEVNPEETAHKRARARKALNKALAGNPKGPSVLPLQKSIRREKSELQVKYANVKKIQKTSSIEDLPEAKPQDVYQGVPRSCMTPVENVLNAHSLDYEGSFSTQPGKSCDDHVISSRPNTADSLKNKVNVKRYSSFSSNDSSSSISSSIHLRKADVSLTSGELTSLSSQADPDSDEHGTDVDLPQKEALLRRTLQNRARLVDSGFDSESSEVSSDIHGHHTYFSSDDSAYVDSRDRVLPRKTYPKVLINPLTSSAHTSETAFVLTGINSEKCLSPIHSVSSARQELSPDLEMDYSSEKFEVHEQNETMDQVLNKPKVIEVLSAPDPVKSIVVKPLSEELSTTDSRKVRGPKPALPPKPTLPPKPSHLVHTKTPINVTPVMPESHDQQNSQRPKTPVSIGMRSDIINGNMYPRTHMNVSQVDNFPPRPKTPSLVGMRPSTPGEETHPKNISVFVAEKDDIDIPQHPKTAESIGMRPTTPAECDSHSTTVHPTETNKDIAPKRPKTPTSVGNRPPTPGRNMRPKTPTRPESRQLEIKGPNVYASPMIASKRYRELTMKGVPLRVSVISAEPGEQKPQCNDADNQINDKIEDNGEENVAEDNMTDDQKLFDHLESNGFFIAREKKDKLKLPGIYPTHHTSRKEQHQRARRKKMSRLALEDIIREIPEETVSSPNTRSPNQRLFQEDSFNNHSGEEAAMLNQPASSVEDSETASVQASSVANSNYSSPQRSRSPYPNMTATSNQPAVVVDAELYIDRIYSQKSPQSTLERKSRNNTSNQIQMAPDFDMPITIEGKGAAFMDLPMDRRHSQSALLGDDDDNEEENMEVDVPLLNGVDDRHVKGCQKLTQELQLVAFSDLLPANDRSFEMLKIKLHKGGQLGNIGSQLLDLIHMCWLSELPPSSSDLVVQLLDPVTETEL